MKKALFVLLTLIPLSAWIFFSLPACGLPKLSEGDKTSVVQCLTFLDCNGTGTLVVSTNNASGACTVEDRTVSIKGTCSGTAATSITLKEGFYDVKFSAVPGMVTPQNERADVTAGHTTTIIGIYVVAPA